MTSSSLFAMVARRRLVLLVTLALALAVLPFALMFLKPTYIKTAHAVMVGKESMIPSGDMAMLTTSPAVLARVAGRFSLGADLSSLMSRIDAKVAVRSNVMPISYRDKDRAHSRDVTKALADETVAYYKQLSGGQYNQMIAFLRKSAGLERDKIRTTDLALQHAAQRGADDTLLTLRFGRLPSPADARTMSTLNRVGAHVAGVLTVTPTMIKNFGPGLHEAVPALRVPGRHVTSHHTLVPELSRIHADSERASFSSESKIK